MSERLALESMAMIGDRLSTDIALDQAAGIHSVLAKLIALGGLAMSLAHATTPMSGYEHGVE
jgi:predicted HAD superfamily phosphohydrolase YqeG